MPGTLNPARPVLCFGAVHWDSLAQARRPIAPDTSTPASIRQRPGGVATNVARALARLDVPVTLCGVIGDDLPGKALAGQLSQERICLRLMEQKSKATGQYLALHDPDGSLVAACVDDSILAEATPVTFQTELASLAAELPSDTIWFADANLPPDILKAIASHVPESRLAADAVSIAKADRLDTVADGLQLLFTNKTEAAILGACPKTTPSQEIATRLHEKGIAGVIITNGAGPVLVSRRNEIREYRPAPANVRDVTGAGDALIAGTLAALAHGHDLFDAVPAGLAAARLTVQSVGAVSADLSWQNLSNDP